ncbi:hypothetical protein D0N87_34995, partial [Pseudomonas sp. ATCC 13867]
EISFARYFYKPTPLRTLAEIRADILALEQQSEGLLHKIVGGGCDGCSERIPEVSEAEDALVALRTGALE